MQRNLLWKPGENKKDYLINWDVVSRPLEKGGLGLGKLLSRNDALLAKWLWRFPHEEDNIWHSIIGAKYRMDVNGWDVKSKGRV